ncbi:MAG: UvrD-helicase domain-containing protein [Bacteroidota bacterium]
MVYSQTKKSLLILNASAGSGKTYNLVYQYIKILLHSEHSYQDFRHILAMTFTNKAANEMKERVLKALDEMSRSTLSEPLENAISIFEKLESDLGIERQVLIDRSKKSLRSLLHSYEDFHVMTIDKFNLKLIRNFSRDLDLPGQFDVEMNTDNLVEKLVDNLLNKIGEKDTEELTELVFSFAKSNLDDGEKWDVKQILVEFAKILTKESVLPKIEKITAKKYEVSEFTNLNNRRKGLSDELTRRAKGVYDVVINQGMDEERVPQRSKSWKQLMNLKNGSSFFEGSPVTPSYVTALLGEPKKGQFLPQEFQSALAEFITFYETHFKEFQIIYLLVKNFHSMALLKFMSDFLEELKEQDQIIQISEFNKLISELIQQSHAPYIYERIGTRFKHYLLDEFQDTSRMQWLNLIPLVEESLGHNHLNFIVGDPKQSIYRFRNGVAEQFVALPRIYNPDYSIELEQKSDFFERQGIIKPLLENRRSAQEVVKFNNAFFEKLKFRLNEESQKFYEPVSQIPTSKSTGFVSIVSAKKKITLEERIDKIVEIIKNCDESGYKRSEICILGEKNKELNSWAIELLNREIPVVSSDSLFVNNDLHVRLTISYLKLRLDPKNKTESKKFADLFFKITPTKTQADYWNYFIEKEYNGKKYRNFDQSSFITDNFQDSASFFCQYETIYSLLQKFYRLMGWFEETNPYLHHLADVVYNFEQKNSSDLKGFLDHYKKDNEKMTVLLPESEKSIMLMTVHKAKGLEFPVVILPNLAFGIDLKGFSKHLIEVEDNVVYTSLKKDHSVKEIAEAEVIEKNQILTDKVNLCYVALTRPRERLYAFNFFQKYSLGSLIHSVIEEITNNNEPNQIEFTSGNQEKNPKVNSNANQTDFYEPKVISDNLWFPEIAIREDGLTNELSNEQKFGNAFHLLMSQCDSPELITKTLKQLTDEDKIPIEYNLELTQRAERTFQKLNEKNIFQEIKKIYNESTIISSIDSIKRPDKIVLKQNETIIIDFKTGLKKEKDAKQIVEYANVLKQMELPPIKAFLFYTASEELLEVRC